MSVYQYIAETNPEVAYDVCARNGFTEIFSVEELSDTLQSIAASGESGLKQVLLIHPDKEVIIELFEKKSEPLQQQQVVQRNFLNASGSSKIVTQTNAFILVGAIIVSLAIVSVKS